MLTTTEKIQKVTSKGQITIPALWRRRFSTNTFIMRDHGKVLEIEPVKVERKKREAWTTIFSAKRDNSGKGVPIEEFSRVLKKLIKQDERHRKTAIKGFTPR